MPEVIPELVYVVGLFFAIVGYLTARGLLATWTHSLGYVFAWLAAKLPDITTHIPGVGHINLKAPFQAIDSWVVTALQSWCAGAEVEMGYCLHGMEKVALYTARMIDWLATETEQTFEGLIHIHLPKWAKWAALAAVPPALLAKLIAQAVARAIPHALKTVRVVTHDVTHDVTTIIRKSAAGAVALPRWVLHVPSEITGLTKRNLRLSKRLHRVELLFGATAMAAAMANVLGLPNWRCLTRGNVGKVTRALCGLGTGALDDLLGLLADVLIVEDVCQVINLLSDGLTLIEGPLNTIIGGVDSALCHGDFDAPPDDPPMQLSLPPVTGLTLSLA